MFGKQESNIVAQSTVRDCEFFWSTKIYDPTNEASCEILYCKNFLTCSIPCMMIVQSACNIIVNAYYFMFYIQCLFCSCC